MGFLLTQTKHSTSSWDYESIILENVEKSSDTALWQKTNNENTTVDTRKPFLSACLDEHKLSCLSRVKETVMRLAWTQLCWVVPTACSILVKPYSDSETPLAVRLFNLG